MNPIATNKRFILRFLKAANCPQAGTVLEDAIRQQLGAGMLQSDISEARRELEHEGLIAGQADRFDKELMFWEITTAGLLAAKSL
jgi:hypothetical protein